MATGADTTLADQGGPVDSTVQLLYSDMQHKTYTDEFASALLNVAQLGGPNDHKEIQMVLYATIQKLNCRIYWSSLVCQCRVSTSGHSVVLATMTTHA